MLLECKEERVSYLAIAFCELLLPASNRKLHQDEVVVLLFRTVVGVHPEASTQADNGRQPHLVHCLFDSLRRHLQHDRPASRPSPPLVVVGKGFQGRNKVDIGGQRCLHQRSFPRGAGA